MVEASSAEFPRQPEPLTVAECYELLAAETVGRVAFADHELPVIVPVNYALDGHHLLLRTDPTSRLAWAATAALVVAFEVDQLDRARHTGWSVVVVGPARPLHGPSELARADALNLVPWAAGARTLLIRVSIGSISGIRLRDSVTSDGETVSG